MLQLKVSFGFPFKFRSSSLPFRRLQEHPFLFSPVKKSRHFTVGNVSPFQRISNLSHPIFKIPNPTIDPIISAAATAWNMGCRRRRSNGRQRGAKGVFLQCIYSLVAWNLKLIPEPLDLLIMDGGWGGGGGGLGFWKKKGLGGGGGFGRSKLEFLLLLLILGSILFLILGDSHRGSNRFSNSRFLFLFKGRRRRLRRRRWAL